VLASTLNDFLIANLIHQHESLDGLFSETKT
jgi:hypothetical protein